MIEYAVDFSIKSNNRKEFYKAIKLYKQKGYYVDIHTDNVETHEYGALVFTPFFIKTNDHTFKVLQELGIL